MVFSVSAHTHTHTHTHEQQNNPIMTEEEIKLVFNEVPLIQVSKRYVPLRVTVMDG